MATRSRYLVGQKLSDYQIEQIIRSYAQGIQASELIRQQEGRRSARAANTIFQLYELIRERLFAIGFYPDPRDFLEAMGDSEYADGFVFSAAGAALAKQSDRLQGVTQRTLPGHLGEMLFRARNPNLTPEAFFRDIKRAIKWTGPLNQPPQNPEVWSELNYIAEMQRQIDCLRRITPLKSDDHRDAIAGLEGLIEAATVRLRKARRLAGSARTQGKTSK